MDEIAENVNEDVLFYKETFTENLISVEIFSSKLIEFWESKGFRNLKMPKGGYQLIRLKQDKIICEADEKELTLEVKKELIVNSDKPFVWEKYLNGSYASKSKTNGLDTIEELSLNKCTSNTAYFFFKNGVLKVGSDSMDVIAYDSYDGYVFESQIIDFEISLSFPIVDCEFDKFIKNVTLGEPDRYEYLTTSLGYIIHGYKDRTFSKALILLDEELDFSGEANGGTGKSIIARAVAEITPTLTKDGKNLNNNSNRFFYQDISLGHQVLYLDDVKPDFDFEHFYAIATGEMTVEEKYKASYKIPFELSPKLLISSNYMVQGSGGESDARRRVEVEIGPYYSMSHTPLDDFGRKLFDDWPVSEWNNFYLTMAVYCQKFINNGVLQTAPINLEENKLRMSTDISFVEFCDSNIVFGENVTEIVKNKSSLYETFRASYPVEAKNVSNIRFKKWLDIWAKHRNLQVIHFKSNSENKIKFLKF